MQPRDIRNVLAAIGCWLAAAPAAGQDGTYGFGHTAGEAEIAGWDIDARPPGAGLPDGSGSVSEGREIYQQQCVSCHGAEGEGPMDRLVGGAGSLDTEKPVKTVGSYWPFATTLFDYIHRAMPFDRPQSLSPDQVYAVTAYVLYMNDLVPEDATMDSKSLPQVEMPNREDIAYGADPRPDVYNTPCMQDCSPLPLEFGEEQAPSQSQVQ